MKARVLASVSLFSLLIAVCLPAQARATKCSIRYTLQGWSAFYKTASGNGTITCDDGQSAAVSIRATGGGLTVGKSKVSDGRGKFSEVASIGELFGAYANAEAHAGMGPSSSAQVMTKGTVSLELTGTGQGVDLGFSFGKFTISKRK